MDYPLCSDILIFPCYDFKICLLANISYNIKSYPYESLFFLLILRKYLYLAPKKVNMKS